jgi:hypothetical protein
LKTALQLVDLAKRNGRRRMSGSSATVIEDKLHLSQPSQLIASRLSSYESTKDKKIEPK